MAQTSAAQKTKTTKSTARDVFFYLLMIVALYISVTSFLTLIFQYINRLLPETLPFASDTGPGLIIAATSALVIAWPVFMIMSWLIGRDLKNNPSKQNLGVKRWLSYVTLFISSIVIIITLIVLVNNFLSGELSLRVGLKILGTLVVAASVLGYYIWDLRRTNIKSLVPKIVVWTSTGLILAGIIGGFFIIGSPMEQRAQRFDSLRVSHIQQIQAEIFNYYGQKDALPQTLDELAEGNPFTFIQNDPTTDLPYEYRVIDDVTFELCAVFESDNTDLTLEEQRNQFNEFGPFSDPEAYLHTEGRDCFEQTIDPDLIDQTIPAQVR